MLKKIIVADTDNSVIQALKSFCNPSKVEINLYSGGEEVLPILGLEDPVLIFLSLDLPDINDFVVFDILKRCSGSPSPSMFILYSNESESKLNSIMKMKFKADGYLKKPVDKSDLSEIIKKNLDSDSYLIPSDLTMKDILGDDDILDLGSVEEEVKEPELESGEMLIENLPLEENNNDHGTREEIKKVTIKSLDDVPDLVDSPFEDLPKLDDSPFQMNEDTDMPFEMDNIENVFVEKEQEFKKEKEELLKEISKTESKLESEFREKEEEFKKEQKKLLRELETSELKLEEKDKEKEEFKNKLSSLSENYEKKMEDMDLKYKKKLKKFEDLLKRSLDEINED